jgi:CubicO group peptidase (beta-lactamase class C family)
MVVSRKSMTIPAEPQSPPVAIQARRRLAQTLLVLPFLACGPLDCGPVSRALTYVGIDPILDTDWYQPCATVAGDPAAADLELEPSPALSAEALDQAQAYAERMGSCALIVAHRGRIVRERYGCGLTADSRPNGMSLAKTPLALVVGVALAEGTLRSLDDPLARYLAEWSEDARGRVTLRHLLEMSSGLEDSIAGVHLSDHVEDALLSRRARRPPGQAFEYNSANSQLLALVLERATGRPYAELLSEMLWRPLQARDARVWLDASGGHARAYCCLFATARDWLRVGLLMQARGRWAGRQVVPAAWVEEMLTPSALEPSYGKHVWLGYSRPPSREADWSEPFVARDTFMLVGSAEQRVYVVPSRELVIVRLGHEAPGWDDPVLPNLLVRALDAAPPAVQGRHPG